jgi:NAD(P)-dependent dehydrogenase (short-subunit alcohol dehydrogenase family)
MRTPAVVVTGSSGGIGRALCRIFRDDGCHVIGVDRQPGTGIEHAYLDVDLRRLVADEPYRREQLERICRSVERHHLRALLNNAAFQVVKPIEQTGTADWADTLNVNLIAPFLLAQALLTNLERCEGSIVNVSSVHATLTKQGFCAYASSKAALEGLTRSLSVELGARVRVNAIAPAAVDTPMLHAGLAAYPGALSNLNKTHPIGRVAAPEEVARVALFLTSASAKFITGAVIRVDGGIGARLHDPV